MNCVDSTRVSSPLARPGNRAAPLMNFSPFLQLWETGAEVPEFTDTKLLLAKAGIGRASRNAYEQRLTGRVQLAAINV